MFINTSLVAVFKLDIKMILVSIWKIEKILKFVNKKHFTNDRSHVTSSGDNA